MHASACCVNGEQDFERLGLPEDDLARVWLAFSRLRQRCAGLHQQSDGQEYTMLNINDMP